MIIRYTEFQTPARRIEQNSEIRQVSGTDKDDYDTLGGYLGLSPRTIRAWFQPGLSGGGILRASYDGTAISQVSKPEYTENTDNDTKSANPKRDRMVLAAILQDQGVYRDDIYTGKEYTAVWYVNNLCEAVRYVAEVMGGKHDTSAGFRLAYAWIQITCALQNDNRWLITIIYRNPVGDEAYNEDDAEPSDP